MPKTHFIRHLFTLSAALGLLIGSVNARAERSWSIYLTPEIAPVVEHNMDTQQLTAFAAAINRWANAAAAKDGSRRAQDAGSHLLKLCPQCAYDAHFTKGTVVVRNGRGQARNESSEEGLSKQSSFGTEAISIPVAVASCGGLKVWDGKKCK